MWMCVISMVRVLVCLCVDMDVYWYGCMLSVWYMLIWMCVGMDVCCKYGMCVRMQCGGMYFVVWYMGN